MRSVTNPEALAALKQYPEAESFLYLDDPVSNDQEPRQSYVYEWYLEDSGTPFYVHRGVRNRYKHILWKLNKKSGVRYKALKENHGINYRILAKDLTYCESKIIAYARIQELIKQGVTLEQPLNVWTIDA